MDTTPSPNPGTENLSLRYATKLAKEDSSQLLEVLKQIKKVDVNDPSVSKETRESRLRIVKDIYGAEDEMDSLGKIGLTVRFNELTPVGIPESLFERMFGGMRGEVYVVGSVLDGSGKFQEFKTQIFKGCRERHKLPLGDGGMLVANIIDPKWFIDIHLLVMESDSDERTLGEALKKAKDESHLDKIGDILTTATIFDPTAISKSLLIAKNFMDLVVYYLKENKDDHIATIHDFYLKHQGFGVGEHTFTSMGPKEGAEGRYTIELSKL